MIVLFSTQNRIKDLVNQANLPQETQRMNGFMDTKSLSLWPTIGIAKIGNL